MPIGNEHFQNMIHKAPSVKNKNYRHDNYYVEYNKYTNIIIWAVNCKVNMTNKNMSVNEHLFSNHVILQKV